MSATSTVSPGNNALGPVPKTMRAGVYREKGMVRVEEVPVPKIGGGEVLIKVAACGICGTDIKKIFHAYVAPPQILGHELGGTVVAVGRGVTKWKPGDRVMSFHHIPCGSCFYCERRLFSQCKQYKTTGLTGGFTPNGGGFGEYVKAMPWVAERGIVALPDDVSFDEATFIEPRRDRPYCRLWPHRLAALDGFQSRGRPPLYQRPHPPAPRQKPRPWSRRVL
jgi:L-iditol 2-dehydrogenase